MDFLKKYFGDLFPDKRFYFFLAGIIILFVIAYYIPVLEVAAAILFYLLVLLCFLDYVLLFFTAREVTARRLTSERFSNGDDNIVELELTNEFALPLSIKVIDELPVQFQRRDWQINLKMASRSQEKIQYVVRPVARGEYHFGNILVFAATPIHLITRRFRIDAEEMIPVYPGFLELYKYQLLSRTFLRENSGTNRMRKIGQSMEFEQIRDYVTGDDIRSLNWKASARRGNLMINNFIDERSQQVYCIIDKGRLMKMPFEGLTLLDHAINSCLVLSNVCLKKQDKVGVITFSHQLDSVLAADRRPLQRDNIIRLLYNQKTDFLESDFEMLYLSVRSKIKNRSLIILFTNFESMSGLQRQLEYLRAIANHHLLLVVFFENTELQKLTMTNADNVEDVYIKTIAEKFAFEKRMIAKELNKFGILSVLSSPQQLTVHTINKYLELKTRQAI
ncbi:DUF58 domain-containing protein [soil metagenome]